jgi:hypothetical protein
MSPINRYGLRGTLSTVLSGVMGIITYLHMSKYGPGVMVFELWITGVLFGDAVINMLKMSSELDKETDKDY